MVLYTLPTSKIFPNTSPLCWRECGKVGNLLHVLWNCPNFTSFWSQTFRLIASCRVILCKPQLELALLNNGIDQYPTLHRPVVTHILVAAWLTILRKWKNNLSPNISDVVTMVTTHLNAKPHQIFPKMGHMEQQIALLYRYS